LLPNFAVAIERTLLSAGRRTRSLILRATVTNINIRHNIAPTTTPLIHSKSRIMSPGVKLWLAGRQPSPVAGCSRWWSGFKGHEASTARMRHLHNLEHQEGHHLWRRRRAGCRNTRTFAKGYV